jgi:hypothetical protein
MQSCKYSGIALNSLVIRPKTHWHLSQQEYTARTIVWERVDSSRSCLKLSRYQNIQTVPPPARPSSWELGRERGFRNATINLWRREPQ